MSWLVDARRRLTSPGLAQAMRGYFGNVATYTQRGAAVDEIKRKTLAEVAAMVREAITSIDYDENIQQLVDFLEEHKMEQIIEATETGLGAPTLCQSAMTSFPVDTDFGFGHATLAMPRFDYGRLNSGYLLVCARPGNDGSWMVSAFVWPRLAASLESDHSRIFKPVTAEYLGLV